jgi:hypothetical protein
MTVGMIAERALVAEAVLVGELRGRVLEVSPPEFSAERWWKQQIRMDGFEGPPAGTFWDMVALQYFDALQEMAFTWDVN